MNLLSELNELEQQAKDLQDGTPNRLDISNQFLCAIGLEREMIDEEETPAIIEQIHSKIQYVLTHNFQGTHIELNELLNG